MRQLTKEKLYRAMDELQATREVIREAQRIHSGELYARLKGRVDGNGFNRSIRVLKSSGSVAEFAKELIWTGR
jgi:hypothetical protein